jgi:hypothetical protein
MGRWDGLKERSSNSPSQGNTSSSPGRFVHLTEHQGDLRLAIKLDDGGFLHFVVQIVALTSTLAYTGEDRVTTVGFSDVVLYLVSARPCSWIK